MQFRRIYILFTHPACTPSPPLGSIRRNTDGARAWRAREAHCAASAGIDTLHSVTAGLTGGLHLAYTTKFINKPNNIIHRSINDCRKAYLEALQIDGITLFNGNKARNTHESIQAAARQTRVDAAWEGHERIESVVPASIVIVYWYLYMLILPL